MHKFQIALLWVTCALSGCGGEVVVFGHTLGAPQSRSVAQTQVATSEQRPALAASPASTSPVSLEARAVNAIDLVLAPHASAQAAEDVRFRAEGLLSAVTQELRMRKLLDESASSTHDRAEIVVDSYSLEPASNAVVFGYIISDATLNGTIRLREGSELRSYRIEARTKLSIPAKEPNNVSLDGLYRRFAVLAADHVAGIETPSELTLNQSHR